MKTVYDIHVLEDGETKVLWRGLEVEPRFRNGWLEITMMGPTKTAVVYINMEGYSSFYITSRPAEEK